MSDLTLYTYCRSSAAYRVRIALKLKSIDYHSDFINLLKDGGEEKSAKYSAINPQQMIPSLGTGKEIITQSLAIIEYLDETWPDPALLPANALDRAYVRSLAHSIACDIHPLDNLRVLAYLQNKLGVDKKAKDDWYCYWIHEGFSALEKRLEKSQAKYFCFGDQPTVADICLIPQVYNAIRFNCHLDNTPIIQGIYQNCMKLAVFQQASPERQADFPLQG